MKKASLRICVAVICIFLSSCTPVPIAIPLFPDEPFQESELQFLVPGKTTLAEIKEHLWEPIAVRNNGRLLLYTESQASWLVWVGVSVGDLEYKGFLFIEMNADNTLNRYEVIINKDGFLHKSKECTSWGVCLDMGALSGQSLDARVDDATYIFLTGQPGQSQLENHPDGRCQIITYLDDKSKFGTLRIQINESPLRAISKKGFSRNFVLPGLQAISVDWPLDEKLAYHKEESPIQKNISCNSGESFYVSVFTTKGIFRSPRINLKIVSIDEARRILKERRLIIN